MASAIYYTGHGRSTPAYKTVVISLKKLLDAGILVFTKGATMTVTRLSYVQV